MPLIAKIAVAAAPYAIDRPYDYQIPAELEDMLSPGMRVAVPFGKGNRISDGIVLSIGPIQEQQGTLKQILAQLDDEPMLSAQDIQLSLWMRDQYF